MTFATRHGTRPRAANRDLVAQLQRLRELTRTPILTREAEYGTEERSEHATPRPDQRSLFDPLAMVERQRWAKTLRGDSGETMQATLKRASDFGASRRVAKAPEISAFAELRRDFPNFDAVTSILERRALLCRRAGGQLYRLPPLLLSGPPGVGKSAYAKSIAALLDVPACEVDAATLTAGFSLSGLDIGYSTGGPGLVWHALQSPCMSPLFFLDELDKAPRDNSYPTLSSLYTLLEPHSARKFTDVATRLPVDASWIFWFATCNSTDGLDGALLSRFVIVDVQAPTPSQMASVVSSVHRRLTATAEWSASFEIGLRENVAAALRALTPREVTRALEDAYAAAAAAGRDHLVPGDVRPSITTVRRHIGFV